MPEYKQCPNGHYYQGDKCPYCKNVAGDTENIGTMKTEVYGIPETQPGAETVAGTGNSGGKTTFVQGGGSATISDTPGSRGGASAPSMPSPSMSGRTVFGDDDEVERVSTPSGIREQRVFREVRKLVGWLVSYTIDSMGVDFKLYEGRNIIGRDIDCNITVNDPMVSSKHAVLLFRSGKYSITDSQSSHGTFVNDNDIELEPCYLQDGDVIRIGQTLFKFRSSL